MWTSYTFVWASTYLKPLNIRKPNVSHQNSSQPAHNFRTCRSPRENQCMWWVLKSACNFFGLKGPPNFGTYPRSYSTSFQNHPLHSFRRLLHTTQELFSEACKQRLKPLGRCASPPAMIIVMRNRKTTTSLETAFLCSFIWRICTTIGNHKYHLWFQAFWQAQTFQEFPFKLWKT